MPDDTPRPARVEVGVFDLSRLPIQWSNVDPEKLQAAVETIESSVPQQVEQLKQEQKKQSKE